MNNKQHPDDFGPTDSTGTKKKGIENLSKVLVVKDAATSFARKWLGKAEKKVDNYMADPTQKAPKNYKVVHAGGAMVRTGESLNSDSCKDPKGQALALRENVVLRVVEVKPMSGRNRLRIMGYSNPDGTFQPISNKPGVVEYGWLSEESKGGEEICRRCQFARKEFSKGANQYVFDIEWARKKAMMTSANEKPADNDKEGDTTSADDNNNPLACGSNDTNPAKQAPVNLLDGDGDDGFAADFNQNQNSSGYPQRGGPTQENSGSSKKVALTSSKVRIKKPNNVDMMSGGNDLSAFKLDGPNKRSAGPSAANAAASHSIASGKPHKASGAVSLLDGPNGCTNNNSQANTGGNFLDLMGDSTVPQPQTSPTQPTTTNLADLYSMQPPSGQQANMQNQNPPDVMDLFSMGGTSNNSHSVPQSNSLLSPDRSSQAQMQGNASSDLTQAFGTFNLVNNNSNDAGKGANLFDLAGSTGVVESSAASFQGKVDENDSDFGDFGGFESAPAPAELAANNFLDGLDLNAVPNATTTTNEKEFQKEQQHSNVGADLLNF